MEGRAPRASGAVGRLLGIAELHLHVLLRNTGRAGHKPPRFVRMFTGRAIEAHLVRLGKASPLRGKHGRDEPDYSRRTATSPRRIRIDATADLKTRVAKSEFAYDAAMLC